MSEPSKSLVDQLETGKHIINFLVNTDKKGKDTHTLESLSSRLFILETYWKKIVDSHASVCVENTDLEDTHDYFTNDFYYDYEDAYVSTKSVLSQRISLLAAAQANRPSCSTGSQSIQVVPNASSLPPLPLPPFSGLQRDWESFKEMFESRVKNVPGIPALEKLIRLLSVVQGDAAARLTNITHVGGNFEVAWQILLSSYDNKRIKLSDQLQRVLNMPSMKERSAAELLRLLDTVEESRRALTRLRRPVDQWDDWFVQIVEMRLDSGTRQDWEKSIESGDDFPTYADLKNFLEHRSRTLATAQAHHSQSSSGTSGLKSSFFPDKSSSSSSKKQKQARSHTAQVSVESVPVVKADPSAIREKDPCAICSGKHFISYCPRFVNTSLEGRWAYVRDLGLCSNCLRRKHEGGTCDSKQRCRVEKCNQAHHTFLHSDKSGSAEKSSSVKASPGTSTSKASYHSSAPVGHVTLLATAMIRLETTAGDTLLVRALLDSGSESSFISERAVQSLGLKKLRSCTSILGVGGESELKIGSEVEVVVRPAVSDTFRLNLTALVLRTVTAPLPARPVERRDWSHIEGLELADPRFFIPGSIDCLLGADVYPALLLEGVRLGASDEPVAQSTVFGWVLTGPVLSSQRVASNHVVRCHHSATSDCKLYDQLKKFWELEELPKKKRVSPAEQQCEDHFVNTHRRDASGRYSLRLPFSSTPAEFPGTVAIAKARFLGLERRLLKKPTEREAYQRFMREYEELEHMERVDEEELPQLCYYVPHHGVFKKDGSGKIRVVFNASQIVANGRSLNSYLLAGPKLQTDIAIILLRWRMFLIVFSADIVKMFRQFGIQLSDRDWLRIFWRESSDQALQTYRMSTVTYGTACAPFQAIRTLLQLANDERDRFPLGAAILEKNMYVDDALTGADNLEDAVAARNQLIGILQSAGMSLDKWTANHPGLLANTSSNPTQEISFDEEDVVSALGLRWKPVSDSFIFRAQPIAEDVRFSKRGLLSVIARLFDPVGWLGPIIIRAKMMLQKLWLRGCDWDQELDDEMTAEWTTFCQQLLDVDTIEIPRFLGTSPKYRQWFLHGFSDASQLAYGAAVYLVYQEDSGQWKAMLLMAKTKVAPIKTVSLPRLELCGVCLLVELIVYILSNFALRHQPERIFCWTDSMVVLAWLKEHPSKWSTFVANRVSDVHTALPDACWSHVRSEENPADCASRGMSPAQLREHHLWWYGPDWLAKDWTGWTVPVIGCSTSTEERKVKTVAHQAKKKSKSFLEEIMENFSSYVRLVHAFAYIWRWTRLPKLTAEDVRPGVLLSIEEVNGGMMLLFRTVQAEFFSQEIELVRQGKPLPRTSKLLKCMPFLDDQGVLRLGGRLEYLLLPYEEKHPVILPAGSWLTALIINDTHKRTLHGGPQLVISHIRRRFWILHLRNRVRMQIKLCTRCERFQGVVQQQRMAPLYQVRGQPSRPFSQCGLDYAGPFPVRTSKGRGQKSYKGYVCLFVCMVTRAIHLEVVSDYSTQTFLAAFRRFIGRRGLCKTVFSDNGTTFQGAAAELKRLFHQTSSFSQEIADAVRNDGIAWKFIPPRAPHFGGLWEAGVKSFKHHLHRVLGDATLTFEEFSTLTVQIEACLNSRPLSPMSSDPSDATALTPGHFLIGAALTAPPEPFDNESVAGISRYLLTTRMKNQFWRRWQKEVLHEYQLRAKWFKTNSSLAVGDLVLITESNLPPTKWPLARVLELRPGRDGLPRVVVLKTSTSVLERPFVKLVRLPLPATAVPDDQGDHSTAGGREDDSASDQDSQVSNEEEDEERR